MKRRNVIQYYILAEGQVDYLGVWEILWHVKLLPTIASSAEERAETMHLLEEWLTAGFLVAGDLEGEESSFVPWNISVLEAIAKILSAWNALEREPFTGDVAWLITTDEGKRWCSNFLASHPEIANTELEVSEVIRSAEEDDDWTR